MLIASFLLTILYFNMTSANINNKIVGFVGTGKISSCLVRGYCSAIGTGKPSKIIVSPRNAEKAAALKNDYPDMVEIGVDNEDVVSRSDVVFVGLLPAVAREVLPQLPFGGDSSGKLVISMMAAIKIDELCGLVDVPDEQIIRTVPLPSAARREGPILSHPPNSACEEVLRVVGTPVACAEEKEMTPLVCLTGHISPFFELFGLFVKTR